MAVIWTKYKSHDDWTASRNGIGASEAGAVCNMGFKSSIELWKEKVGEKKPDDISGNERVQFGNDVEGPLRSLFRIMNPEYSLSFTKYTVLRRDDEYSFMFYTPDGWLTEKATGKKGLYESKSSTCLSKKEWDKWAGKVPDGYYLQLLHGMFVGDFDFAVLFAILLNSEKDAEIRAYRIERADCQKDMEYLLEKEAEFWKAVESKTLPKLSITF